MRHRRWGPAWKSVAQCVGVDIKQFVTHLGSQSLNQQSLIDFRGAALDGSGASAQLHLWSISASRCVWYRCGTACIFIFSRTLECFTKGILMIQLHDVGL